MRFVTFDPGSGSRIGVIEGDRVVDVRASVAAFLAEVREDPQAGGMARARIPDTFVEFLEGGERAWSTARQGALYALHATGGRARTGERLIYAREEVRLEAPLRPKIMLMGGANFDDHLDETKRSKPDHVEFFLKAPHTVVGPGEPALFARAVDHKFDYEVELAIVIGKRGRNIPLERVYDHIFGYTILNDISARTRQVIPWDEGRFQLRFGEGKNYDTGCPLGPWVVTRDELVDPTGLDLRTWINGELRQNNNTRNMLWPVPELVSYYSQFMTLEPGFVIASGTPGGPALGSDVELGADPYERADGVRRGRYMQPGDRIRMEIEGIGVLENPFVTREELKDA